MVLQLRACVIALVLTCAGPVTAQEAVSAAPAKSAAPSVQGTQVAGPEKAKPTRDDKGAAPNPAVQHGAGQPPDNQAGRGDSGAGSDGKNSAHKNTPKAEEVTAEYTVYLVFATIALVVATIVLAVSTYGLYKETKQLAQQAVEASEDTKRSIAISERSADASIRSAQAAIDALAVERAWMIFDRVTTSAGDGTINGVPTKNMLVLVLEWINSGRSPAVGVEMCFRLDKIKFGEDIPEIKFPESEPSRSSWLIGQGKVLSSTKKFLDPQQHQAYLDGELRLIASSKVWYKTIGSEDTKITEIIGEIIFSHETEGRIFHRFQPIDIPCQAT